MFKVVEFDGDGGEDGELGVVREEWLTPRKTNCLWPPYKTANNFNKCLNNREPPNKITWTLCPVVLGITTDPKGSFIKNIDHICCYTRAFTRQCVFTFKIRYRYYQFGSLAGERR